MIVYHYFGKLCSLFVTYKLRSHDFYEFNYHKLEEKSALYVNTVFTKVEWALDKIFIFSKESFKDHNVQDNLFSLFLK